MGKCKLQNHLPCNWKTVWRKKAWQPSRSNSIITCNVQFRNRIYQMLSLSTLKPSPVTSVLKGDRNIWECKVQWHQPGTKVASRNNTAIWSITYFGIHISTYSDCFAHAYASLGYQIKKVLKNEAKDKINTDKDGSILNSTHPDYLFVTKTEKRILQNKKNKEDKKHR